MQGGPESPSTNEPHTAAGSHAGRQPPGDGEQRLVQVGWRILSRDGHELGEVAGFEGDDVIVGPHGVTADRMIIPRHYIGRESETEMRATLTVDDREAQAFIAG